MDKLIKSRVVHDNGDTVFTMSNGTVVTMNKHGDGFWKQVLDRLWAYEEAISKLIDND